ncbi:MAG: phage virion morphogenesis protein [Methylomonas sp.]|nr:phage virion morphogenesis protein [Methylomonas sp.]
MIEVKIDDAQIIKALQRLQHAVVDISPALLEIGEILTESTKKRFSAGVGPDGTRWAENSDVTIERKGRNKPLVAEGSLSESIAPQLIGDNILEVGSALEYAAMQQFGGTKAEFPHLWGDIPARPFLGLSSDDESEILASIERHVLRSI